MNLIEIDDISKFYGQKQALKDVCLQIPEGQIFGLLGPNGAGKTTLIRIINKIIFPTSGQVRFQGHPMSDEDVLRVGYLPEERGLYRKMKVGEQSMFFARLKGMDSASARKALQDRFEKFGMIGWWDKKVEELSKGMAQKVQFITTVVHNPSLMILDEPFSGFDPVNAQLIRDEILELRRQGTTIILSTHNMESVEQLCEEIALINKSEVVINGAVDGIRHRYGSNNIELVYTGEAVALRPEFYNILSEREEEGKRIALLSLCRGVDTNSVLSVLMSDGMRVTSFREILPRMNDIFIKLVKEGA